jgi:hypothetical protein
VLRRVLFQGPELVGGKRVLYRQVLVSGWGIMVCCGKCALRMQYPDPPVFQPEEGHGAGNFMYQVAVYKEYFRTVLDPFNDVRIPNFVE